MSDKKPYRHIKTGKVAYLNDLAYSLVQDSYLPDGEESSAVIPKPKKKEDAAEDDELEKVRGIWRSLFNDEPNPRKVVKTLQKEIDEFKSEEK